ncbi:hypothetical protein B4U80_04938 [Leptotrombidium deliense]|uniref:Neuroligin-4: X-linked-like protein n=1 Tax=Leptotrombidium deliense TaxID=299467 RepID=A0A443SHQ3_9ACAR|nr:hypothetical protein B4U80_04938 [Leptotrombidium deliense]
MFLKRLLSNAITLRICGIERRKRKYVSLFVALLNICNAFHIFAHRNPTANVQLSDNNNNAGKMSVDRSVLQNVEKSFWPQYDEKEQQYMSITVKPKVRDHFQAHRLSYWLNLIPKLHIPGPASASQEHHLLQDFDDIHSYEGIVRESAVSTGDVNEHREKQQKAITTQSYNELQIDLPSRNNSLSTHSSNDLPQTLSSSSPSTVQSVTSSANDKQRTHLESAFDTIKHNKDNNINASMSMFMQQGSYSTALSVTIAIGCSLLLLNILIFAGILYQKDRMRNTNTDAGNKKMELQSFLCRDSKIASEESS